MNGEPQGTRLCVAILAVSFFFLCAPPRPAVCEDVDAGGAYYLLSYFVDNEVPGGGAGLHLGWSADGLNWSLLRDGKLFFRPRSTPMMRDPNIARGADGVFHMVWTSGWNAGNIGYASSTDLIHWSADLTISVMADEPATRNTWAPELFWDDEEKRFLIFWSSTIPGRFPDTDKSGDDGYNHRIYYTTTRDFQSFEPTKLLYDPGFDCIDATIVKADIGYVMFLKDETLKPPKKHVVIARAEKPTGPWGEPSRPITMSWVEGPSALRVGKQWIVYFDMYALGRYGAIASEDMKRWKDIGGRLRMPKGARHGTVFEIDGKTLRNLLNIED